MRTQIAVLQRNSLARVFGCGAGRVSLERIPYAVPRTVQFLKDFRHIVIIETGGPIAFFSFPDKPSRLKAPDCVVHSFFESGKDSASGLEMLLDMLHAHDVCPKLQDRTAPIAPPGKLDPVGIAQAIAASMPEGAILVDESLTTGRESMGSLLALCRRTRFKTWAAPLASARRWP